MKPVNAFTRAIPAAAFSRTDLMAVILVLAMAGTGVAAFLGKTQSASRGVCAANLKQLGVAMAVYEQDNGGRLPYAYYEFGSFKNYDASQHVWDSLIFPYVPAGANGLAQKHLLRCPADTLRSLAGVTRRTYAMPAHSNKGDNWPLSPENQTGLGVWYSRWEKRRDLTNYITVADASETGGEPAGRTVILPAFKLEMIHAPGSTLLLTEHATVDNTAFNFHGATIDSEQDHLAAGLDLDRYHGGKINYLLVDGHVELLYPLESIGQADPRTGDAGRDYPNLWSLAHQ